jgi:hypothetical protein
VTEELKQIVEACEAACVLEPAERTAVLQAVLTPPALITLAQSGDFRAIGRVIRAATTSESPAFIGWLTGVICSPDSLPPLLKSVALGELLASDAPAMVVRSRHAQAMALLAHAAVLSRNPRALVTMVREAKALPEEQRSQAMGHLLIRPVLDVVARSGKAEGIAEVVRAVSCLDKSKHSAAWERMLTVHAMRSLAKSDEVGVIGEIAGALSRADDEARASLQRLKDAACWLPDGAREKVIAQLASSSGALTQRSEMSDPPWKHVLNGVGDTSTIAQRRLRPPRGYALT